MELLTSIFAPATNLVALFMTFGYKSSLKAAGIATYGLWCVCGFASRTIFWFVIKLGVVPRRIILY